MQGDNLSRVVNVRHNSVHDVFIFERFVNGEVQRQIVQPHSPFRITFTFKIFNIHFGLYGSWRIHPDTATPREDYQFYNPQDAASQAFLEELFGS